MVIANVWVWVAEVWLTVQLWDARDPLSMRDARAEFQVEANPAFPVSTAWSSRIPGSSLPDTRQGEARDGNQAWVIEEESLESLFCYQMGIIPQGVKLEEDPCSAGWVTFDQPHLWHWNCPAQCPPSGVCVPSIDHGCYPHSKYSTGSWVEIKMSKFHVLYVIWHPAQPPFSLSEIPKPEQGHIWQQFCSARWGVIP